MRTPAAALALLLSLAACSARDAGGALQQWTDEQGNVRYTTSPEQVPRDRRYTLTRVEPGKSAEENAAALPGARTVPVPPPTAAEWLRGEEPGSAGTPETAAAPPEGGAAPDATGLDERIRGLESDIAAAQTELDQANGADNADAAQVDAVTQRLGWLQEQLEAARAQRAALPPTGD
jgi:hypothetical protein